VIILQTLPPIVIGLWTRWCHGWALLAGWAVGLVFGLYMVYDTPNPTTGKAHFGGSSYLLSNFGFDSKVTIYTGFLALAANLLVVIVGTLLLRRSPWQPPDETVGADYEVEAGDPGVEPVAPTVAEEDALPARGTGDCRGRGSPCWRSCARPSRSSCAGPCCSASC
jgi:SSS family solute:Na+ symporter